MIWESKLITFSLIFYKFTREAWWNKSFGLSNHLSVAFQEVERYPSNVRNFYIRWFVIDNVFALWMRGCPSASPQNSHWFVVIGRFKIPILITVRRYLYNLIKIIPCIYKNTQLNSYIFMIRLIFKKQKTFFVFPLFPGPVSSLNMAPEKAEKIHWSL